MNMKILGMDPVRPSLGGARGPCALRGTWDVPNLIHEWQYIATQNILDVFVMIFINFCPIISLS